MLTKGTEYAIRALVYVQLQNWEQKRPGVGEIAKEIEAPEAYSGKILQTLTKHRLVNSMKGRGGGFSFTDNQSNLTLYDVIIVMEGDGYFRNCGFGLKDCNDNNPCPLHSQYITVRDRFYDLVQKETIQSLAKRIHQGKAVLNRIEKSI
jgi:Rrf2 family protein